MILAAKFHIMRGEHNYVPIDLLPGGVAAFVIVRDDVQKLFP
jgi:hypothetical protein